MIVAFDVETALIQPGNLAPPLVCGSFCPAGEDPVLLSREDTLNRVRLYLQQEGVTLAGANIAYDFGVIAREDPSLLPLIFLAYEQGRVFDVQIAQALHAIAEGHLYKEPSTGKQIRYSLDNCVRLVLGRDDAKVNDYWRLRYWLLRDIPISQWPEEAVEYPKDDARNTLEVALRQMGEHKNLHNMKEQSRAAWSMHLGAMWGLRTDGNRISAVKRDLQVKYEQYLDKYKALGFIRPDGTENQARVKCEVVKAYGGGKECGSCEGSGKTEGKTGKPVNCPDCNGTGVDLATVNGLPLTEKGGVSKSRDTLLESDDPVLNDYAMVSETKKLLTTYIPFVEEGVQRPISLRPNVLVASGRTSYNGLIQLLPRSGGIRECFVPRVGYYFCSIDYSSLELATLAQACLWLIGQSRMSRAINEGKDLHSVMGAQLCGVDYEEFYAGRKGKYAGYRQAAKAANFGFPGGMGSAKLVLSKRSYSDGITKSRDGEVEYPGIRFCIVLGRQNRCGEYKIKEFRGRAIPPVCKNCVDIVDERLRPAWFSAYPEMVSYFKHVSDKVEWNGQIKQLVSDRVRGGVGFCDGANSYFQGLAADGAKHALWSVCKEAYTDVCSPMYGSRPIMFVHDEIFSEIPIAGSSEAAKRMAEVMVSAMREYTPDVRIDAEPALMRRWYKGAEPMYDENGNLVPWEPETE